MIFPVKVAEHIFVAFFAGTEYDDLNSILTQFIHDICDQVKAFLVCQTGNDTDQHYVRIFVQPEVTLKLKLVFDFFLAEGLCIIILCNVFICLRIEYIIIDSVDDTAKVMGTRTEKSVQSLSVERCLDLFGISITYCCYCICKYNSTFEEVCIFVCFQLIRGKIVIRKTCDTLYGLDIPYALEFQIVDRHNRLDSPEKFILLERIMQIYRNKTCLPVVAVDHIRAESDHREHGENCF